MKIGILFGAAVCAVLSAQGPNFTPPNPLYAAAMRNDTAEVKRLLTAGANPNEGRLIGMPPLFFAVFHHNLELVRAMIERGADLHATDGAGSSVLMWAAASEKTTPEIVEELLKRGADPQVRNKQGDSALTWALRRGDSPIVATLRRAGATDSASPRLAVERALALLQRSGSQFVRVSGCASCHHQSLPQMAVGAARAKGFAVNEEVSKQQAAAVVATYKAAREIMLQGTDRIPDPTIGVSYALLGLHAEGYAADETTAAMAHLISTKQRADGSFPSLPARPPMESSDVTATALSLRAIQAYGANPEPAVAKAAAWLRTVRPRTTEERAMQLLGLAWAKAGQSDWPPSDLGMMSRALLAEQRADGGWAQLSTLESDAYATGQALAALLQSGQIAASSEAYRRGAGFLLRAQLADGSWLVRSRAFPFQPLKDSGFPHGRDQWSSAAGSSWAALALAMGEPAVVRPASAAAQ
ncbi:MAG: ankyrin repeat domain-containing protein [Bryobacteraceae bacterium]|nr:ankyrin repeat domain-containing protein [Bryobacteraceae bacterium]